MIFEIEMEMRFSSRKSGLTLIELLSIIGVLAVVTILMVILLVSAQENRRKSLCAGNLSIVASALSMYEIDHNGRVLPCSENWWKPLRHYLRAISSTMQVPNILICPSTPENIGLPPQPRGMIVNDRNIEGLSAYAYNVMLGGNVFKPDGTRIYGPPKLLAKIAYPEKTVRITEMWRITSNDGYGIAYPPSYQATYSGVVFSEGLSPQFVLPPGWHNTKSHVLWVDGHVTAMVTSQPTIPAEDPPAGWQVGVMENDPADKWFTTSEFKGGN